MLMAGPLWADDTINCDDPQTQFEMNTCAAIAYDVADARLNAIYKVAMADAEARDAAAAEMGQTSPVATAETLRQAQRDWITFRNSACTVEAQLALGGSMMPMLGTQCWTKLTERRTADLEYLTDWGN